MEKPTKIDMPGWMLLRSIESKSIVMSAPDHDLLGIALKLTFCQSGVPNPELHTLVLAGPEQEILAHLKQVISQSEPYQIQREETDPLQ